MTYVLREGQAAGPGAYVLFYTQKEPNCDTSVIWHLIK